MAIPNEAFFPLNSFIILLEVIKALEAQRISQVTAATKLGLSTRQVRRLQKRYQMSGITGLTSQHRGKKSNNQLSAEFREEIAKLIREKYRDFGPNAGS